EGIIISEGGRKATFKGLTLRDGLVYLTAKGEGVIDTSIKEPPVLPYDLPEPKASGEFTYTMTEDLGNGFVAYEGDMEYAMMPTGSLTALYSQPGVKVVLYIGFIATYTKETIEGKDVVIPKLDANQAPRDVTLNMPGTEDTIKVRMYVDENSELLFVPGQEINYKNHTLRVGNKGKSLIADESLYSLDNQDFMFKTPKGKTETARVQMEFWGFTSQNQTVGRLTASDKLPWQADAVPGEEGLELPEGLISENLTLTREGEGERIRIDKDGAVVIMGSTLMPLVPGSKNIKDANGNELFRAFTKEEKPIIMTFDEATKGLSTEPKLMCEVLLDISKKLSGSIVFIYDKGSNRMVPVVQKIKSEHSLDFAFLLYTAADEAKNKGQLTYFKQLLKFDDVSVLNKLDKKETINEFLDEADRRYEEYERTLPLGWSLRHNEPEDALELAQRVINKAHGVNVLYGKQDAKFWGEAILFLQLREWASVIKSTESNNLAYRKLQLCKDNGAAYETVDEAGAYVYWVEDPYGENMNGEVIWSRTNTKAKLEGPALTEYKRMVKRSDEISHMSAEKYLFDWLLPKKTIPDKESSLTLITSMTRPIGAGIETPKTELSISAKVGGSEEFIMMLGALFGHSFIHSDFKGVKGGDNINATIGAYNNPHASIELKMKITKADEKVIRGAISSHGGYTGDLDDKDKGELIELAKTLGISEDISVVGYSTQPLEIGNTTFLSSRNAGKDRIAVIVNEKGKERHLAVYVNDILREYHTIMQTWYCAQTLEKFRLTEIHRETKIYKYKAESEDFTATLNEYGEFVIEGGYNHCYKPIAWAVRNFILAPVTLGKLVEFKRWGRPSDEITAKDIISSATGLSTRVDYASSMGLSIYRMGHAPKWLIYRVVQAFFNILTGGWVQRNTGFKAVSIDDMYKIEQIKIAGSNFTVGHALAICEIGIDITLLFASAGVANMLKAGISGCISGISTIAGKIGLASSITTFTAKVGAYATKIATTIVETAALISAKLNPGIKAFGIWLGTQVWHSAGRSIWFLTYNMSVGLHAAGTIFKTVGEAVFGLSANDMVKWRAGLGKTIVGMGYSMGEGSVLTSLMQNVTPSRMLFTAVFVVLGPLIHVAGEKVGGLIVQRVTGPISAFASKITGSAAATGPIFTYSAIQTSLQGLGALPGIVSQFLIQTGAGFGRLALRIGIWTATAIKIKLSFITGNMAQYAYTHEGFLAKLTGHLSGILGSLYEEVLKEEILSRLLLSWMPEELREFAVELSDILDGGGGGVNMSMQEQIKFIQNLSVLVNMTNNLTSLNSEDFESVYNDYSNKMKKAGYDALTKKQLFGMLKGSVNNAISVLADSTLSQKGLGLQTQIIGTLNLLQLQASFNKMLKKANLGLLAEAKEGPVRALKRAITRANNNITRILGKVKFAGYAESQAMNLINGIEPSLSNLGTFVDRFEKLHIGDKAAKTNLVQMIDILANSVIDAAKGATVENRRKIAKVAGSITKLAGLLGVKVKSKADIEKIEKSIIRQDMQDMDKITSEAEKTAKVAKTSFDDAKQKLKHGNIDAALQDFIGAAALDNSLVIDVLKSLIELTKNPKETITKLIGLVRYNPAVKPALLATLQLMLTRVQQGRADLEILNALSQPNKKQAADIITEKKLFSTLKENEIIGLIKDLKYKRDLGPAEEKYITDRIKEFERRYEGDEGEIKTNLEKVRSSR
ncbi:MAG: hypothetical protein JSV93_06600, partial [Candidatus Omnitrophota bacterium]